MTVKEVRAEAGTHGRGLVVTARLQDEEREVTGARLPARETATLLPREFLVGTAEMNTAEPRLLETVNEMLTKLVVGRSVRMWEYDGRNYFSFLPWRGGSPRTG